MACCSLSWLMDGIVLVCSGPRTDVVNRPATDPTSYELLLFPRQVSGRCEAAGAAVCCWSM